MIKKKNFFKRSQDLEPTFHDAGQFYWANKKQWKKNNFFTNYSYPYFKNFLAHDIDDIDDWKYCEYLYQYRKKYEGIPYSKQFIDKADVKAVTKTLYSDYLTTGPVVKQFENKLSKYCNSKYAICLNSATSGLLLACKSLDLKKKI